jgi:hypothetical protein
MTHRPHILEATEQAVDERTAPEPGERKYATGARAHTADPDALRAEQQDEIARSWYGLGVMTDGQLRGGIAGTLVGGLVGALVFLPLGLFSWTGLALGWRLGIAALCGAVAGATAMAIYLGGREPELEGEVQDLDGRPSIGTTRRDPRTDGRGR